ncbi:VOC family protein [Vreelandella olivaria]|uniref:VOC family protein n=1 Tax=Vreelandella olivaria TaxID=390919 RepID=UPI00201E75AE|nr:hydroxylase [Halomonas olivaria]
MKVHYLEIVSLDIDAVCQVYESTHGTKFGAPDALLGGARICQLPDGSSVGVRGPLREIEEPVARPYWLVDDIDSAISNIEAQGAQIAMAPTEIPGKGKFAIYILGANEHGLWQI